MTTELQIVKLDKAFDQLDINSNGQIERGDVLALGSRLVLGFGQRPGSGIGKDLLSYCDGLWAELAAFADVDHDDSISPAEFRDAMIRGYIEGDQFDRTFKPTTQTIAALCDHDGDGLIGPKEFRTMQLAFGTDDGDSQVAYAALSTTPDGLITVPDFVDAAREYYTSADPQARGNLFFGNL
jgi:Ca2+-binding EF-hand superfamily protein